MRVDAQRPSGKAGGDGRIGLVNGRQDGQHPTVVLLAFEGRRDLAVVRANSAAPSCRSSCWIASLTRERETPRSRAAWTKLRRSITRAKARIASILSIVPGSRLVKPKTKSCSGSIASLVKVVGSTFPDWIGSVRTTKELQMVVDGDQMTENFQRPDGTELDIRWRRDRGRQGRQASINLVDGSEQLRPAAHRARY